MIKANSIKSNFDEINIKFISRPLGVTNGKKSDKEFTMVQKAASSKITPAVSAMKRSADFLFM